jgi:hypothetical protein
LPQPPQLLALLAVLTQVEPHSVGLAEGQVQEPPWQVCGDVQAVLQLPQ